MSDQARKADFPDIARQLVEFSHGDGLEIALGGGRSHFTPKGTPDPEDPRQPGRRIDGRDLTRHWVDARPGSSYVWNRQQLLSIDRDTTKHLLGLFEPDHMKFEVDRANDPAGEPSLEVALQEVPVEAQHVEGAVDIPPSAGRKPWSACSRTFLRFAWP